MAVAAFASLAAAVLVVVAMALLAEYTKTRGRLLLTALVLAGFFFTSISPAALLSKGKWHAVGLAGLAVSLCAAVLVVTGIWGTPNSDGYWKATAILSLMSAAFVHTGWMLLLQSRPGPVAALAWAAVGNVTVLTVLSVFGIAIGIKSPPYWWAVTVLALAHVAGLIAAPFAGWWARRLQNPHQSS